MPLEVTMKYEHKQGRTIPYIVEACVEHLTTYAMEAEGIFRLVLQTNSVILAGCLSGHSDKTKAGDWMLKKLVICLSHYLSGCVVLAQTLM